MQNIPDILGGVVKAARLKAGITAEALAERVDVTERYLYRIENKGQKPSFDVLCRLIRALNISPEEIFYPEKPSKDSEVEEILRLLSACDERSLEVVKATAKALIATAPAK
ncbi:MAG: helix-turn-helix transcriptional regulator [Subdoligranulum sp.]|nr:helix-turn-helix transcriptional regulator [Subdoligranulum sp.]